MTKPAVALAVLFSMLSCSNASFAQGVSEYGAASGGAASQAAGLNSQAGRMRSLTESNFSNIGAAIFGAGGHGSRAGGGASGVSSAPVRQLSDEQVQMYSALVVREYKAYQACMQKSDQAGALVHLNKVVSTREDVWGKADPFLPQLYQQQGDLYYKQGKKADAINSFKKELLAESKRFGDYSQPVEKTTKMLAQLSDECGNQQDAGMFLKKLFDIQSRPGGNKAAANETCVKLCSTLTFAGDYQTAEAMLRQALNAQIASKTPDSSFLEKLYECYGALLRETHRESEATEMEQRAEQLKSKASESPAVAASSGAKGATAESKK